MYDSAQDTLAHITRVRELLELTRQNLSARAAAHDQSKLEDPEKKVFDEMTPKLKNSTYGSDEYKSFLSKMSIALDHHYKNNRHHPEHWARWECDLCFARYDEDPTTNCTQCGHGVFSRYPDVTRMSLFDLLEMLCDWKAAGERHANGSMAKSLEVNKVRFKIPPALQAVLENTAKEMGFVP